MPTVSFEFDDTSADLKEEETLLQLSLRLGNDHMHACGGHARCSTCRIVVESGLESLAPRNSAEKAMAERLRFPANIRLACQTKGIEGSMKVRRLIRSREEIEMLASEGGTNPSPPLGEARHLAILFSDIRSYTTLTERAPAYDVIHGLNTYFYRMGKVVKQHRGQVINLIGDAVLAVFGLEEPASASSDAVHAALDMQICIAELQETFQQLFHHPLDVGIGVHYGEAIYGYLGAVDVGGMNVIGDAVNMAARVESLTKEFGAKVLISEDALHHAGAGIKTGQVREVPIKGKTGSYAIHEVLGIDD